MVSMAERRGGSVHSTFQAPAVWYHNNPLAKASHMVDLEVGVRKCTLSLQGETKKVHDGYS